MTGFQHSEQEHQASDIKWNQPGELSTDRSCVCCINGLCTNYKIRYQIDTPQWSTSQFGQVWRSLSFIKQIVHLLWQPLSEIKRSRIRNINIDAEVRVETFHCSFVSLIPKESTRLPLWLRGRKRSRKSQRHPSVTIIWGRRRQGGFRWEFLT